MPPLLHLPAIVSEATQRRLTQGNGSTQNEHAVAEALQQILPSASHSQSPARDRPLPARSVNDANFDDAYVSFIMYCNPHIPNDTDTTELKKIFRAPPKSDGKTFSTFTLFELIRKLELKELKTWAALAMELGVEPPDLEKGQSAQKVQQYAVRLKRWLHAMHVDAFFEYLLGKMHTYWTHVPAAHEPVPESGRDGVTADEDLALRALLPETRPKRGRKRAGDLEAELITPAVQRRRFDSPTLSEDFMIARASINPENGDPVTPHPGFRHNFDERIANWSATEPRSSIPESFRWNHPDEIQTPASAYPRSAVTPSSNGIMWNDDPRSAVSPDKARSKRRHGPAVSSAWKSSTTSGKLRGRPPSNRSVTDGPFSTFPANPPARSVPTINLEENGSVTPTVGHADIPKFFPSDMGTNQHTQSASIAPLGRPSGLQLQVPQRQGGAVRLATPPPVSLMSSQNDNLAIESTLQDNATIQPTNMSAHPQGFTPMMEYFNTPSTADQDASFQHFVSIAFRQTDDTDRTNVDALESHFISEILSADWLNASGTKIGRCSIDEAAKICKQVVKNLQAESSSTEAFLINLSALAGGPLMTRLRMTRFEHEGRTEYECHWKMRFGSIEGDFTIRAAVQDEPGPRTIENPPNGPEAAWKQRYLDLQQQIRERDQTVSKLKMSIIDAMIASNHWASA